MTTAEKPGQITMLEAKGISIRDCFRFRDRADAYYAVSRTCQFIGLDGEPAALSEDEIWERYDAVEKISRAEYEAAQAEYRDKVWRSRGQPDARELDELAPVFVEEYCRHYADGHWKAVCMYDEETLRRLLDKTVDALFLSPPTGRERQKKYQAMYRDLVLAKAALATGHRQEPKKEK